MPDKNDENKMKWLHRKLDKMTFNTLSDHDAMRQANIFLGAQGHTARLNFGLGQTARFELNGDPNPNDAAQQPAGQREQPAAPQEQPDAQDAERPFNAWNPSQPPNPRNPFDERNYKMVNGKRVSAHTVAEIHRLNAWHDAKNRKSAKAPSPDRPKINVFSSPIGESSSRTKTGINAELDAPYYGPASGSGGSAPRATKKSSSKSKNPFACNPFANTKKAQEAKKPAVKKPLETMSLSMLVGKLAEKEKDKKKKDKKERENFEVVDLTGPNKKMKRRRKDDEDDDNDRSCNWIGLGMGSKRPKMRV